MHSDILHKIFISFSQVWAFFQNIGTLGLTSSQRIRSIRLINSTSLIVCLIILFDFLVIILISGPDFVKLTLPFIPMYAITFLINHRRLHNAAQYYLMFNSMFFVMYMVFLAGKGPGLEYYLIVCGLIPMIVIQGKKQRFYIALLVINILCFFAAHLLLNDYEPIIQFDNSAMKMYFIINLSTVFGLIFIILLYYKKNNESYAEEILLSKDIIEQKNKNINDSLEYAKKIQNTLLTSDENLNKYLNQHFVLFKPKDVVSGDFYWAYQTNKSVVWTVADCTGHGVPGAFMSMLGITLLNEELGNYQIGQPGEILNHLRLKVKEMLAQEGKMEDQKDGMDMAIAIVDHDKKELQFAGAYNSLYLIRNKEQSYGEELEPHISLENEDFQLFELKGDKQPIGVHWQETDFSSHTIGLLKQDSVYIFSDGFIDQFGGNNRKKYKSYNFKKLLLSIQKESMENQKQLIENAFETWRGDFEQIDDVCVIGVKI